MSGRRVGLAFIAAAMLGLSLPAWAQHRGAPPKRQPAASGDLFYDVSDDPKSLKLLALSSSGSQGAFTLIDVIDVMRKPNVALQNTWRIDCSSERMTIIRAAMKQEGSAPQSTDVSSETISTRASPASFRIAQLACTGEGQLVERRMHRGELDDIVKRFSAQ